MTIRLPNWLYAALVVAVFAGCAAKGGRAPVSEHEFGKKKAASAAAKSAPPASSITPSVPSITPPAPSASAATPAKKYVPHDKDWRPQTYVVQKGDTLYSIAFNHGMDYREIVDLNNIQNPGVIQVGQEIRLFQASSAVAAKPAAEAVPAAEIQPVMEIKPATEIKPIAAESNLQEIPIKAQPKVAKLPYSEQAVAEITKIQELPRKIEPPVLSKVEPPRAESKPEAKPEATTDNEEGEDTFEWSMPTNGRVIGEFSESANQKGVDIAGKLGQAVVASAAGKVVYSGNGLRGYGKLVIIKHNKTFLSAYAHNDQILVKEGQTVTKGQKIAEMGNSDTDQVKLHFEIRKFGKPVDPAKYLPLVKS